MKGHPFHYSPAELAWLKANRHLVISEYVERFRARFDRRDVTKNALHALRKRKGWKTGRTGCFPKGNVPANKGKQMPFNQNRARTQFKKGHLPKNYRGPGHEFIGKDGYVVLIVAETNPHTGAATRPVQKHRWLWEQVNGPVPAGHALKCLDGNRTNCDPANWVVVPRALLPRLAGRWTIAYDAAPPELRATLLAVAKLEHSLREKQRSRSPSKEQPR